MSVQSATWQQTAERSVRLFTRVAESRPSLARVAFGYALWLGLLPPLCAYIGGGVFGWRFGWGIGEALYLSQTTAVVVAVAYYLGLLFIFAAATALSRWMAPTYGATQHLGLHAALVAIVGTPLMLGGLLHLYPLVPLNLLCLAPALICSAYLLFTGLPVLLGVDAHRGLLMAASLLGVFFTAALALAAATMILWTHGIGPDIGFHWPASVGFGAR